MEDDPVPQETVRCMKQLETVRGFNAKSIAFLVPYFSSYTPIT